MKWNKFAVRVFAVSALLAAGPPGARAQETGYFEQKLNDLQASLKNAVDDAQRAVRAERYATAADDFSHAAHDSRQLRIYSLAKYLPPAQPGFIPQNLEASGSVQDESLAAYSPGDLSPNSVKQDYIKGNLRVEIIITADAPNAVLETRNAIDTPVGKSAYGEKETVAIGDYPALVQPNPYPGYGGKNDAIEDNVIVSVPFQSSYMIIGVGPRRETLAHLAALDFNGLEAAQ